MADDIDSGIDKRKILDEIGASAPLPAPAAPPPRAAVPRDIPPSAFAAMAPPTLPAPEAPPVLQHKPKTLWERHRRQIAGLVLVFVSILWFGVGLATGEMAPFGLGATFLGLAVLVGVGSLVRES